MTELEPSSPFSGRARLFPLPDNVLYPSVVQPLHIFESRYLEMVEDALVGDRLIAMALLRPGWQGEYHGRPPVEDVVCLGHILSHEKLENGRYNLLLRGASRAKLVRELPPLRSYREVELELFADIADPHDIEHSAGVSERLIQAARQFFQGQTELVSALQEILKLNVELGHLSDLLAHLLPLDMPTKQTLLREPRVATRVEILLSRLEKSDTSPAPRTEWRFPPDFGTN